MKSIFKDLKWTATTSANVYDMESIYLYLNLANDLQNSDTEFRDLCRGMLETKSEFVMNFSSLDARAMRWCGDFW